MSFQGDVAGIGLGELLQGLARGGRDGVLTLRGRGLEATLGLSAGQIYLLPEPDEDPEMWRKRCERAWAKDPNQRIDTLRMSEIAFAARLETMFQLLDGDGLHFRFEPGAIPTPSDPPSPESGEAPLGRLETGSKLEVRVPVHCHGVSVEFLLLEHARLADECRAHGDATMLPEHFVPRLLVPEVPSPELERFWSECDGMSTVVEMSDRLGWPLRQCKASLVDLATKGYLRFCDARELLALAQREIEQNRFARAASRLASWCMVSPPGPPPYEDGELLLQEWERGKLPVVLASMEPGHARTLLRRIDLVDSHAAAAVDRWKQARTHHRHDTIAELRHLRCRMASDDEADAPGVLDILRLAREFQDRGQPVRAGVLLAVAAERMPESTAVRLEVGTRLLAVGRPEPGIHWILEACRTLVDAGHPEKALGPLRSILAADKSCREARHLLSIATTKSSSGKRSRRVSVVALSTALVISMAAFVKVRVDQDFDRRLAEVQELVDRPEQALIALDRNFGQDDSPKVAELRGTLLARIRARNDALRSDWLELYNAAKKECANGDPFLGLQMTLELPDPPRIQGSDDAWPTTGELLDVLAARLEQSVAQLPPIDPDGTRVQPPDAVRNERRFDDLVQRLERNAAEQERTFTLDVFLQRLQALRRQIQERNDRRGAVQARRQQEELLQEQNDILAAARVAHEGGDLERADALYTKLMEKDPDGSLRQVFRKEIGEVRREVAALRAARKLAEQGRHDEAVARIEEEICNPRVMLLPCTFDSRPPGARARLGDGSIRVAPFVQEIALGERLEVTFQLAGYEDVHVSLDGPLDVLARLPRLPASSWSRGARVNALPVPLGDGHVVADREGRVARLDAQGHTLWELKLQTLGGVARTPVFLPRRQGTLLVVTEHGEIWLIDAEIGRAEGPWNVESPPRLGPIANDQGVLVSFGDGRVARWVSRLEPQWLAGAEALPAGAETGDSGATARPGGDATGNLRVLRASAGFGTSLAAPWGEWTAEVDGNRVVVTHASQEARTFFVRTEGHWSFLAWETPTAMSPSGRLWVSDDEGLRAFEP